MRRALVCAAIVVLSGAAHAQAPPPPDQPAAPAPPKKKKKKPKRPKLVTETEVYGRPKKGQAQPAAPPTEPAPPPPGLLAPTPAPPAPAPAPEPTPPPAAEAPVAVPTLSPSSSTQEDKAEKRFDPTASVPPPDEPPQTFSFRLEPALGYRRFLDTEASSTDKRSGTPGVFLIGGRAELYPFAGSQAGFMRDFGLTGSYFRAISITLTDFDKNEPVPAVWYSFSGGVRARLLGRRSPFALGLTAGYESWTFDFDTSVAPIRLIPKGRYSLAGAGFDMRETFGIFSVFLEATYLYPLHIDDLGDRVPMKSGAYAGRGTFGIAFRLARSFEIDAHGTYTVVRFSLASVPGRADEPGRVFDQYLVSALGLRLNL
jgi:hypothetical protein